MKPFKKLLDRLSVDILFTDVRTPVRTPPWVASVPIVHKLFETRLCREILHRQRRGWFGSDAPHYPLSLACPTEPVHVSAQCCQRSWAWTGVRLLRHGRHLHDLPWTSLSVYAHSFVTKLFLRMAHKASCKYRHQIHLQATQKRITKRCSSFVQTISGAVTVACTTVTAEMP